MVISQKVFLSNLRQNANKIIMDPEPLKGLRIFYFIRIFLELLQMEIPFGNILFSKLCRIIEQVP